MEFKEFYDSLTEEDWMKIIEKGIEEQKKVLEKSEVEKEDD